MTAVVNVNDPFAETITSSPPLLRSVTLSPTGSPLTVPPTVYVLVVQATATLVTIALAIVPLPLVTTQVWFGVVG